MCTVALGDNSRSKMKRLGIKQVAATFLLLICLFVALSDGSYGEKLGLGRNNKEQLPDKHFKASSENPSYPAKQGRLKDDGWAPLSKDKDPYPYLQIELYQLYLIGGIKIQGCKSFNNRPAWVTRFRVQVSTEENFWDSWNYFKPEFYGGKDHKDIAYTETKERKLGKFVRIFPIAYKNWACMKVELYGKPYIDKKVEKVAVLGSPVAMNYLSKEVKKVEGKFVTVKGTAVEKTVHSFDPDYAQVIPLIKPRESELKVDSCVLAPRLDGHKNEYMSGRVHKVKGHHYDVEWLMDVKRNAQKMEKLHFYHRSKLYVVFGAWCKKIDFAARVTHGQQSKLCLGKIVRVDSKLVFQSKNSDTLIRIPYEGKDRPPVSDYVSSQKVEPDYITVTKTELYYEDYTSKGGGCLSKGKVTHYDKTHNMYTIDGRTRKRADEVRYSKGHGFEECKKGEKHCQDSRIPYKVNRRRCPYLKTWDGNKCKDEDECKTGFAACGENAVCKNTAGFYKCSCPKGFKGSNPRKECKDINECNKKVCHKDAKCQNTPGSFSCSCKKGYHGDGIKKCVEFDECKIAANKKKCEKYKNGMCKNAPGSFSCVCKAGYHGKVEHCEDVDECLSQNKHKCSPHAKCTNTIGSYKCKCKKGYTGDGRSCTYMKKCKERSKNAKCHQNSKCVDISGGSECRCKNGFSRDGMKSCVNVNECKAGTHKCVKNAICTDRIGSYSCKCRKDYTGDGKKYCKPLTACLKKFPDCDSSTSICDKDKDGKFSCRCKPGYKKSGSQTCTDIDECTTGVCSKDADCVNTLGSFSCSCRKGFQGNGMVCSDVDECKSEGACSSNAACTNNKGSFNCECNRGFNGNAYKECADVDECKLMNCGYGMNCTNIPGSYVCSCAEGFIPDTKQPELCKDVDECATISSPCGTYHYLSCENEPGTYNCRCKMGYTFSKKDRKCVDENECKKKSACVKHAKCTNAEGSYSCICAKGYSGDGLYYCEVEGSGSATNKAPNVWNLLTAIVSILLVLLPWKI